MHWARSAISKTLSFASVAKKLASRGGAAPKAKTSITAIVDASMLSIIRAGLGHNVLLSTSTIRGIAPADRTAVTTSGQQYAGTIMFGLGESFALTIEATRAAAISALVPESNAITLSCVLVVERFIKLKIN